MHPTDITDPADAPAGYTLRAQPIWDLAREDYLAGDSRTQVCDRYGLNLSTFKDRARREGWRKADQPDAPPLPDDDPEADEPVDCAALAEDALVRVRRALRRGRAGEAASWMRLHEKLTARREAEREAAARRARVEAAQGSAGASDPLERSLRPLRHRMAIVAGAANLQMRLSAAYRRGQLLDSHLDRFSGLNYDTLQALREITDPPGRDDPSTEADPSCSHPDFSAGDDP